MKRRFWSILLALLLALSSVNAASLVAEKPAAVAYAKQSGKTYKITYKLKGGTNSKKNPTTYKKTSKTITLKNPSRRGYTFGGWFRDKKYKKKISTIKRGSVGNVTLYAKWTVNKYTLKFSSNRGKGTMTAKENLKYDKEYTLPANAFTREGYVFTGWNTKPDGSGTAYDDRAKIKNLSAKSGGKATLYAQWEYQLQSDEYGNIPASESSLGVEIDPYECGVVANDGHDDHDAINEAIYQAYEAVKDTGGKATVTLKAGVYDVTVEENTTAIKMRSNVHLRLERGAILRVRRTYVRTDSSVIGFYNIHDATLSGGKIVGPGDYGGEDIYGVWIKGCKNIKVSGMEITENQCDGIYISPQQAAGYSIGNSDINIIGCNIHDNKRNNISIIDADQVSIKYCTIRNAGDRQPCCGICIEPNLNDMSGDKVCRDILIQDTTISTGRPNSSWEYRTFYTYDNSQTGHVVAENVRIVHCNFTGYFGNYNGKNVIVSKDTRIDGDAEGLVRGK